jgi:type VI secretion system VgrG family protein
MADTYLTTTYDYTFSCAALDALLPPSLGPASPVIVTRWQGTEGVSRLYRYTITIAVTQGDLALEKLLNQPATLAAWAPDGTPRQWHGIVTQGAEQGRDDTHHYYQLVLEPRMARLRNLRWSDIYLKRDLADLIKQLLGNAGLTEPYSSDSAPYDYRIAATQLSQTQTDFTCQFEETCLDFLLRKLEHYGVYFWFEQGASQESVVFANGVEQQPAQADTAVYYPKGTIDPDASQIAIMQLNRSVGLPAGLVMLHDTPEHPNTTLTLSTQVSVPKPADMPALGEFHSAADHFEQLEGSAAVSGTALATWRAEEIACASQRVQGQARTPGLRAGRFLDVSEYLRGVGARQYYVIEVTHEGTQAVETAPQTDLDSYRATFVALPRWLDGDSNSAPLQFRAPRTTPIPRISQLINGFVDIATPDSPKRFAQPDANGCYKVRFLFARQRYDGEQNSAFLRMATPYAGGTSSAGLSDAGMHFPLREGTEVLIAFLNGDPDRPVIVSALPNTEAPSVVNAQNSAQHVIGTPGGNTMVLADAQPGGDGAPAVRLYSPTENTSLNLGKSDQSGVDDGFHIKTDLHGELYAGSSMLIEVPGHYRVAAGSDSNESEANFLGSEVQDLPSGITIGQSGGIVIENFLGVKIESVEAVCVEHFFGAKAEMSEAAVFESTLGFKLSVEGVAAKEINLLEKNIVRDAASYTNALTSWIVGKWNGIAAEKTEEVGQMTVTVLENYDLLTPSAFLGGPTACMRLGPAGVSLIGESLYMEALTTANMISTASTTITVSDTFLNMTPATAMLESDAISLNATGDVDILAVGDIIVSAPLITLG